MREIKEIHAEYMYVWYVWHFGKDRAGVDALLPRKMRTAFGIPCASQEQSCVCVCVFHANVGCVDVNCTQFGSETQGQREGRVPLKKELGRG